MMRIYLKLIEKTLICQIYQIFLINLGNELKHGLGFYLFKGAANRKI